MPAFGKGHERRTKSNQKDQWRRSSKGTLAVKKTYGIEKRGKRNILFRGDTWGPEGVKP